MKKLLFIIKSLCLITLVGLFTSCTHTGDYVKLVQKLPNEEAFTVTDNHNTSHHLNLGMSFQQDRIFFLPARSYGEPEYVLYYEGSDEYSSETKKLYDWTTFSLDEDEVQYFVDAYDLPRIPEPNIWDRFGFWILLFGIPLVFGIILRIFD